MLVRVVVADDNRVLRAAVQDVLGAAHDMEVVASVPDGPAALAAVAELGPDVLIMDVEMPGGGPELAQELARRQPGCKVLCLSARDDATTVLRMLAAGATAYVAKGALDDDLATCVRRANDGMLFVVAACAPEVRRRISDLMGPPGPGS